ncbi:MAG: formylglycine-generating enzyme family protein [Akkermansiaceae bacterium]|jgi:formylglycine-generating enzyme|nr:formylglycine-generating enzyme family protein [Akkermansiaceae bacterium]MDP4646276.1 formylglycine-generating enzyme family protein [Akkermansiaceae bacterium]MDP4720242.1 formylglycine-generating enzyme family protein [Akkermansiaceae bacterium]MDP4779883.1 formylglycine-generating enzyme family protein [Akkermansiaceae bacterium]MDP4845850.1 formylglycine-generating enzyme family protein [Akkermansiaceae bacterium]
MKLPVIVFLGLSAICQGEAVGEPHGHRLVTVPAGKYELGSQDHSLNKPHVFETKGFRIADAETTNAQFAAFVEATGYVTHAERNGWSLVGGEGDAEWVWKKIEGADWRHPFGADGQVAADLPDHPVTQISGEDARAYCKWAGGRLPHFDEWEVAARAGAKTLYPWGGEIEAKHANIWNGENHRKNTREDGFVLTAPVRSFPPNTWGLYDVIGNVFEYCEGYPVWMDAKDMERKICGRGGSWWCSAGTCHFYNLLDMGRMFRTASLPNQGFRIVFEME